MDKDRSVLSDAKISIEKNILRTGNTILQLSNISLVEVGPIPKAKYPSTLIMGCVIGLILTVLKTFTTLGVLLMIVCGIGLLYIYNANQDPGKYLIIELNSGNSLLGAVE